MSGARPNGLTRIDDRRLPAVYLAALGVAIVAAYATLLRYYFAQDDFILIAQSVFFPREAFLEHFQSIPGQFRPLTKVVYFFIGHSLFGMNAIGYRVVAIAIHILNTLLVYMLLRRCRGGVTGSLVAATLFGTSTGFFHVLAWISCIQQLLCNTFTLSALILGIDAVARRDQRRRWISLGMYILALMCYESAFPVPALLALHAWLLSDAGKGRVRRAFSMSLEHWLVMGIYLGMMTIWRRVPDEGTYAYSMGVNAIRNFVTYIAWSAQYQVILPMAMNAKAPALYASHVFILLLTALQLVQRRWREALFAFAFFGLTISPALFLENHTYYLHTYLPAIGLLVLVALGIEDVLRLPRFRERESVHALLTIFLVGMGAFSFYMVRQNERALMYRDRDYRSSFVIRRAMSARKVCETVARHRTSDGSVNTVYMVYGRMEGVENTRWNNLNVIEATGKGAAIRLLYGSAETDVRFMLVEDVVSEDTSGADVFMYDDFGNCRLITGLE